MSTGTDTAFFVPLFRREVPGGQKVGFIACFFLGNPV
jgi:hypothetical protein